MVVWRCIDRGDVTKITKLLSKSNSLITSIGDDYYLDQDLKVYEWEKNEHTRMHLQKVREYV